MALREITSELRAAWRDAGLWPGRLLVEAVDEQATSSADRCAVADQHDRWSYAELAERSTGLARWFVDQGLEPGDVVAVQSPNRVVLPLVHLACARADLVFLPMSDAWGATELRYLLGRSGARIAIVPGADAKRDPVGVVRELRPELPELRAVGGIGAEGTDFDVIDVATRVEAGLVRTQDPDDPRYVMVTSGTTGVPRMSLWTDNNLWAFMEAYIDCADLQPASVSVGLAPASTGAIGYVYPVLAPLLVGSTSVLLERWSPAAALDLVEREQPQAITAVPTQLVKILQEPSLEQRDLTSVRVVTNAGAAMPQDAAEEIERIFGARTQVVYGATDGGVPAMTRLDDPKEKRHTTVGRILPHAEVRIVDPDGEEVPRGERGEIWWRGPIKHLGYLNEPEMTDAAFHGDGWYRSGDLGVVDEDGYLSVVGRVKDLIIRGGQNISPTEIEAAVAKHDAVADVAVVGLPDPVYGERVCACVELRPGRTLEFEELVAFLRAGGLTTYKLPERLEVFPELPKSAGGKISKVELRQLVLDREGDGG